MEVEAWNSEPGEVVLTPVLPQVLYGAFPLARPISTR